MHKDTVGGLLRGLSSIFWPCVPVCVSIPSGSTCVPEPVHHAPKFLDKASFSLVSGSLQHPPGLCKIYNKEGLGADVGQEERLYYSSVSDPLCPFWIPQVLHQTVTELSYTN